MLISGVDLLLCPSRKVRYRTRFAVTVANTAEQCPDSEKLEKLRMLILVGYVGTVR